MHQSYRLNISKSFISQIVFVCFFCNQICHQQNIGGISIWNVQTIRYE